jgi:hypothetical protein
MWTNTAATLTGDQLETTNRGCCASEDVAKPKAKPTKKTTWVLGSYRLVYRSSLPVALD